MTTHIYNPPFNAPPSVMGRSDETEQMHVGDVPTHTTYQRAFQLARPLSRIRSSYQIDNVFHMKSGRQVMVEYNCRSEACNRGY
jgi:hypothetical protein